MTDFKVIHNSTKTPPKQLDIIVPISVYIEDGIVIGRYNVEFVTFAIAMEGFHERIRLSEGKSYPLLVDLTFVKDVDNETKTYFSSKDGAVLTTAGALLVKSVFQKIAGNFFMYFNKPPMPSRIFTDEEEALKWLSQFKEQK